MLTDQDPMMAHMARLEHATDHAAEARRHVCTALAEAVCLVAAAEEAENDEDAETARVLLDALHNAIIELGAVDEVVREEIRGAQNGRYRVEGPALEAKEPAPARESGARLT